MPLTPEQLAQSGIAVKKGMNGRITQWTFERLLQVRSDLGSPSFPTIVITQGEYADPSLPLSHGHLGVGAVDLRVRHLTPLQRSALEAALQSAGFAMWTLGPRNGYNPHIHAVDSQNPGLNQMAKTQVSAFARRRASYDGYDPNTGIYGHAGERWPYRSLIPGFKSVLTPPAPPPIPTNIEVVEPDPGGWLSMKGDRLFPHIVDPSHRLF